MNNASFKRILNNCVFILPDADAAAVKRAGARLFTKRGANPACELGERICSDKAFIRRLVVASVNKVIPFGYQIIKRTARYHRVDRLTELAERNAAVHTSCALLGLLLAGQRRMKLVVVLYTLKGSLGLARFALKL